MESQIDNILNKIENNQYPDNGEDFSTWGVGFSIFENVPMCIFDINALLYERVKAAKGKMDWDDEEQIVPQINIDYRNGRWLLFLNHHDNMGSKDEDISVVIEIDRETAKILLERMINGGFRLYDVMNDDVI